MVCALLLSGPWEVESEECGAILTTWNLGSVVRGGATLSIDIEAKLQRLTTVESDHRNWSWPLDPNMPPVPPVISRVPALSKSHPTVEFARSRCPGRVVSFKREGLNAVLTISGSQEVGFKYCWTFLHVRLFNTCFLQKESKIEFDESDEEEMQDLLLTALACPIANAGRSHMTEDARASPSNPINSKAQGASSAAEVIKEGVETLPESADREGDPGERPDY